MSNQTARARMRAACAAMERVKLDDSALDYRYRTEYREWLENYRWKLRACYVPGVRDPGKPSPRW
jgi:hypothetical protein